MRARVAFAAAMILAGVSVAACAGILGFDRLEAAAGPDATTPEASTPDVGVDAGPDPCDLLVLPQPPENGSGGQSEFWFATSTVDFGLEADAGIPDGGGLTEQTGFNLDRRCTVSAETSSCRLLPNADFASYQNDKTSTGVDNAGYKLLQSLSGLGSDRPFAPSNINARMRAGRFNLVFRVSGYNNTPNDRDVLVNYFPSSRGLLVQDAGPPRFDDTDTFLLDDTRGPGGFDGLSIYQDKTAYVTNGTIVAHFDRIPFTLDVSDDQERLTIWLSDVVIVGTLSTRDGGAPTLDRAVAAGRWSAEDFLREVGKLVTAGSAVCQQPDIFNLLVKSTFCPALDLRNKAAEDNKNLPCDALSAVLVLRGYNVKEQSKYQKFDAGSGPCANADLTCPSGDAGAD